MRHLEGLEAVGAHLDDGLGVRLVDVVLPVGPRELERVRHGGVVGTHLFRV